MLRCSVTGMYWGRSSSRRRVFSLRVQQHLAEQRHLALGAEDRKQPRRRTTHIASVSTHCAGCIDSTHARDHPLSGGLFFEWRRVLIRS
jgi:hypothetical protein